MIVNIICVVLGVGGLTLGALQLSGVLPSIRRTVPFPNYTAVMNILVGIVLLALAALHIKGVV